MGDFSGSPGVKTSPSNAGGAGRSHMPHSQKNQNIKKQKQYCNKFNKNFKNGLYKTEGLKTITYEFPSLLRGNKVKRSEGMK